jgi:hypothetical protein
MSPDEIETRITRLEMKMTATQVLVHTLLPATVPGQRHQILKQFGQWCDAMATQADALPPGQRAAQMIQVAEAAAMYTSLEGALKLVSAWEARKR